MPSFRDSKLEEQEFDTSYEEHTIEEEEDTLSNQTEQSTSKSKRRRSERVAKKKISHTSASSSTRTTRRSSMASVSAKKAKKATNKKAEKLTNNKALQAQLKDVISECFGYEIRDFDISFVREIFNQLPKLNEIWGRIGFDQETKEGRLDKFYKEVIVSKF